MKLRDEVLVHLVELSILGSEWVTWAGHELRVPAVVNGCYLNMGVAASLVVCAELPHDIGCDQSLRIPVSDCVNATGFRSILAVVLKGNHVSRRRRQPGAIAKGSENVVVCAILSHVRVQVIVRLAAE